MTGASGHDVGRLVLDAVPYIGAFTAAFGSEVLEKINDNTVDLTAAFAVRCGRQILSTILPESIRELSTSPLAKAIRRLGSSGKDPMSASRDMEEELTRTLAADVNLAAAVNRILQSAPTTFHVSLHDDAQGAVQNHGVMNVTFNAKPRK